jgi:hypothetical protein
MVDQGDHFQFRIPVLDSDETNGGSSTSPPSVPLNILKSFREDGFVVFDNVISNEAVDALCDRLEDVLRGHYDRGISPDKAPRLLRTEKPSATGTSKRAAGPIGFSGNLQNVKVLQIINIHKVSWLCIIVFILYRC